MRWCFAVSAAKDDGSTRRVNHLPGVVEAVSRAEAEGLAWQIVRKAYPATGGWYDHFAVVDDASKTAHPDTLRITPAP